MGKRELAALGIGTGAPDVEGPRSRRKVDHAPSSSDVEMENGETGWGGGESKEEVKVQGLKLWQIVKDATKDGRSLTIQFLKQPHRRTYPDYYVLITHPIALEDIKKKLDSRSYATLEAVRQDLELCFTNAKAYNRKESEIYQDARDLLKLTNKTFRKMMPSEEEEGKHKPLSLNRLIKSRLQKLFDRTDDDGRSISYEFMELPSRKDWPIYYKEIMKPQCLNNIMKRIKHKEYATSSQFAEDVELVFVNALHFNQEGTIIWEDARTLRDYFRTLMADMPPPFDLPQYSRPTNKIKIKMPVVAQAQPFTASSSTAQPIAATTSTTPSTTRVESQNPAAQVEKQEPVPNAIPPPTLPVAPNNAIKIPKDPPMPVPTPRVVQKPTAKPAPKPGQPNSVPKPVTPAPLPVTTPAPMSQPFLLLRPSPTPAPQSSEKSKPPPKVAIPSVVPTAPTTPSTPVPPPVPQHRLKCVKFRTEPRGRWINLDHRDGVASWAMRLDKSEQSLYLREITFFEEDDEEEESGREEENEEEDVDMEVDISPKQGKKKKRGRGRPKATRSVTKAATKAVPVQKKKSSRGETQVKLNGTVVDQKAEGTGRWTVDLVIGPNMLEVGEKGGAIWKIYAERMG